MTSRTKHQVLLDVRYGARFGELNERFYRRLDLGFGFIGLFFGSAVVVGVVGHYEVLSIASGILVAACAIIERLVRPAEKAYEHRVHKRKFAELDAKANLRTYEEIDAELKVIQIDAPSGITLLSIPAFNANLRSHGHEDLVIEETAIQRFASFLA